MSNELWLAVLSSSLISGVLGALIAGWFSLRVKRTDYANEYYKLILARRISAYEEVERLVTMLKAAVLDEDKRPYHLLFSKEDDHQTVYRVLFMIMSNALWLSDELFGRTRELNVLVFSHGVGEGGLVEFGKQNYATIAELRTKIERVHARDMLELHKIPRFLKRKKPRDSYTPIAVPPSTRLPRPVSGAGPLRQEQEVLPASSASAAEPPGR
jgi:hypothetical protein